ncbi:transposase [Bradyrhizobium elkanii]|nr:transposase [Bradyrhizobium elkanii]
MEAATIGLDISKHAFHIHAINGQGQMTARQRLRRSEVMSFFSSLVPAWSASRPAPPPPWAREIRRFGHDVRLIPPAYVKPYVRRGAKNDAADAAVISEAVTRPNMRFVPVKSIENQGFLMLHRERGLLVRQRTMTACARAHFAEFGIVVEQGQQRVDGLVDLLDDEEPTLPADARMAPAALVTQLKELDQQVEAIERELAELQRAHRMAKLLSLIPNIGPNTATALAATVPDPTMFRSGREFAVWLGLTPKQNSTGGKDRLGRITKQGDAYLRHLLVIGARNVVRYPEARSRVGGGWIEALLERRRCRGCQQVSPFGCRCS